MNVFHRMKKKRKRSTSSSSSSSSSFRRNSSSSSSSSSRRRSKKKKKKRKKSERASKRRRRISSRESRKSEEGKSGKERKEDEEEWYPVPPNTSATFLNQKGGLRFGERDEEEEVEAKNVEESRISQLYSLSAASDDEESDSSHQDRKRRNREEDRKRTGKNSLGRSPKRVERRGRSKEKTDESRERGKEDNRRDSNSRRRSSLDENIKRKVSCSSAESEHSRISDLKPECLGNSGSVSKHLESRQDSSRRNSLDGGRYENKGQEESREKDDRRRKVEVERRRSEGGSASSEGPRNQKHSSLTSVPAGGPKKDLPSNLLNIFNQIAQFEKEKGVRPK